MGRKFGDSNGGKPFLQRSGKSPAFKMVGSSPAKDTEPHTGKGGHKHTKKELGFKEYDIKEEGDIDITREGVGTTTTPATVRPGKPYESKEQRIAGEKYWEEHPEKRKEYEASLTTPEKVVTKPISTKETVEKPTREQRYRYEKPPVVASGANLVSLNIGGERVSMTRTEYTKYLKDEGYTKDKRGDYRRRSTTGKGAFYNPEMVNISEKPDFDYSEIDYKDSRGRQFRTDEERKKSMEYQETLKKAKEQEKYRKSKKK